MAHFRKIKNKSSFSKAKNYYGASAKHSHITSDNSLSYNEISFNVLEDAAEKRNASGENVINYLDQRAIISSDEMFHKKKSSLKSSISFEEHKVKVNHSTNIGWLSLIIIALIIFMGLVAFLTNYLSEHQIIDSHKDNAAIKMAIVDISYHDPAIMKLNSFLQNSLNIDKIKESDLNIDELDGELRYYGRVTKPLGAGWLSHKK